MTNLPFLAALLAAMLHVISGPDHLAAVTPLAIENKHKAWKIGLLWGVGHIFGMLLIGVLFLLFKSQIPLEAISGFSEQLVGIVLVAVGLWAFYRIFKEKQTHNHPHIHQKEVPFVHIHKHKHTNNNPTHDHHHAKKVKRRYISSFGIGLIHGFAGVAHFFLLLPILSFDGTSEGVQYIIGFGVGTLLAMTAYAMILGKLTEYTKQEHHQLFFNGIRLAGGLFAVVIGVYWLYLTF